MTRGKRLKYAPLRSAKDFRSDHLPPKAFITNASNFLFKKPNNLKEALIFEKWCDAMHEKYKASVENKTCSVVPFDPSMNVVGCKWVYKLKRKSNESIDRYKARLVEQVLKQIEGVDFNLVYNPIV